jgi:hypothetical protein
MRAAPRAVAGAAADPDFVSVGLTDGTVWITEDGGESFRAAARMDSGIASLRVVPL